MEKKIELVQDRETGRWGWVILKLNRYTHEWETAKSALDGYQLRTFERACKDAKEEYDRI